MDVLLLLLCAALTCTLQYVCNATRVRLEAEDDLRRQSAGMLLAMEGAMQMATCALITIAIVGGWR